MTRLSDLLRGAADRAPIDEVSVSIQKARRGVRIQRGIRGAANGVAGVGAATLIFVGVVNPTIASGRNLDDSALAPAPAPAAEGTDVKLGDAGTDSYYYDGWGACGSYLDADSRNVDDSLALSIEPSDSIELEGGATLDIPTNLTATMDITITTPGPEAAVVYEGLVVARLDTTQATQVLDLANGSTVDSTLSFPLVNCFDGAALPAGKYELVVSQAFSHATDEPGPEPTPLPEPSIEPTPVPEPTPVLAPSLDAENSDTSSDSNTTTTGAAARDMIHVEPDGWWEYREEAPAVPLLIAGDPVDDPFGEYFWSPPDKPEDILTPAKARALYDAGLVSGRWDMAPGTSRWIIQNNEYDSPVNSMRESSSGWFGCSGETPTGIDFPTESAVLDLLDVSVTFPSRINLSYGWVVDDNPQVHITLTNTSEYSLPGLFGEPSRSLYLVKDGRVVAEAWPQNISPYSNGVLYERDAAEPDEYWGTLSPGSVISGDYLWRDLNGCWTDSGPRSVTPGTYTLLASQSLYVNDSGDDLPVLYKGFDDPMLASGTEGAPVPAVDPDTTEDAIEIAPDGEPLPVSDWVELQLWTSLGTVTITTS